MKKITIEMRNRDVQHSLKARSGGRERKVNKERNMKKRKNLSDELAQEYQSVNKWIDEQNSKKVIATQCSDIEKCPKNRLIIHLPEVMDFYKNYEQTNQVIIAIRKLVNIYEKLKDKHLPKSAYFLKRVNFDKLKKISTSAALVLTSEISKWDTTIRKRLIPLVDNWDQTIYQQFTQLGFFDLFENKPRRSVNCKNFNSEVDFVPYVKGKCGKKRVVTEQKKALKHAMIKLTGKEVDQWTILHSGLSEAVTNVSHHAYHENILCEDKSWYLTGSFNKDTKEMKVAFYDQGVGIPNSLPASTIWEKAFEYISKLNLPIAERGKHSTLLEAAVKMDRTRTDDSDRGKGLQDLIEFIRQRGDGYLTIISYLGLYKCSIIDSVETSKTASFKTPLRGTLIIWSINLAGE